VFINYFVFFLDRQTDMCVVTCFDFNCSRASHADFVVSSGGAAGEDERKQAR